ncbi:putative metal-binding motif-containing protein [Bradymonas sediminis]|uniref:Uncharacterized protein n=1 Tax=Bradymonas sediminis TaxID=1548548 RepID=A0A2Z4FPH4_9DELT|nr:putative metal-binding motif-containing protein [Bradymonas sediminis]AWV90899.1 hypothetical protein DN745_16845 [Bradymonas sediminis]TDP75364.1 putative metal-binding protein [Bradymonas sediminis]
MTDYRRSTKYAAFALSLAFIAAGLGACSDDDAAGKNGVVCEADELYDQLNDTCVSRDNAVEEDAGFSDTDEQGDISGDPDATGDVDEEDVIDMAECDKDNDGALSIDCGGMDCDDNNPAVSPFLNEVCDNLDNNCSGTVNGGIECTFYAHTRDALYKVDPFAKTLSKVSDVPGLQDIDTHPDGTLFGIKHDGVYRYDSWGDYWIKQGSFGRDIGDSNGLAIDQEGTAYITSDDKIYSANLMSGRATFVGQTGNFKSSGDCVVDKGNTLYMTSKEEDQMDTLVELSKDTGAGTPVGEMGAIGFEKVYSLTAAWGTLYGLNSNGQLIEINQRDGTGSLIHTFPDKSFWGAASTPNR